MAENVLPKELIASTADTLTRSNIRKFLHKIRNDNPDSLPETLKSKIDEFDQSLQRRKSDSLDENEVKAFVEIATGTPHFMNFMKLINVMGMDINQQQKASERFLANPTRREAKQNLKGYLQHPLKTDLKDNIDELLKQLEGRNEDDVLTEPELKLYVNIVSNEQIMIITSSEEIERNLAMPRNQNLLLHQLLIKQQRVQEYALCDEEISTLKRQMLSVKDNIKFNAHGYDEVNRQLFSKDEEIRNLRKQINELEKEKELLQMEIRGLRRKVDELKIDITAQDDEIKRLQKKISKLENEKEELHIELRELKSKIDDLKQDLICLDKVNHDLNKKIDTMADHHSEDMQKMFSELKSIREENETLQYKFIKINEEAGTPLKRLVGNALNLFLRSIYKNVHPTVKLRKEHYSINDLENSLRSRYDNDKMQNEAVTRWGEVQSQLLWQQDLNEIVSNLVELRDKSNPLPLETVVDYADFREGIRELQNCGQLDQEDAEMVKDFFTNFNARFSRVT